MMALKRKKMYETQRDNARGARFNLESQILAIEGANSNLETLNAMKIGSASMKAIHGKLDIEQVDETMADIREQMDLANEISDAISNPLAMDMLGGGIDEDELEAELEQIEQSELDKSLLGLKAEAGRLDERREKLPATTSLGTEREIPTGMIGNKREESKKEQEQDEDDELEKLKASMALT